jgi:hypothetical protein
MFKKCLFFIIPLFLISPKSISKFIDSTSFRINTRLSFYTSEDNGEMLLHIPQKYLNNDLSVILKTDEDTIGSWSGKPLKKLVRVPFNLNLTPADYKIISEIKVSGNKEQFLASGELLVLKYKSNEVKTDRLTGGLVVNRRQFFPFGFYCYSPVYPTLPEEEVVKGFNMISPYQKILPEAFHERKAYMDRCAQLGMKVNYNLLSVSGGGGVSSKIEGLTDSQKMNRLINEISAFRDHPALLAWYISDEPTGNGITPDSLMKIYKLIKENDPWHPVSVVFMAPFISSVKYTDALDIVMADPYPVPNAPVTLVGNTAGQLSNEFKGRKPVWIVPQAFGGGEWWSREPSLQELRTMTYQSIINGARGIQYFVRQGFNLFPKSTAAWGECGRMAIEIAELTPWLLSDEIAIPVRSGSQNIMATSAIHNGEMIIMAVNKTNAPHTAEFFISGQVPGHAKVLFENRTVNVNGGYFSDQLPAFGSQVYLIDLKQRKDTLKPWTDNLIVDPGFEDIPSPGVPSACYARNGGDRGATYFLDSREHVEGNHSVRLVTPKENGSAKLRFFPVSVKNGGTYYISIWAKADTEQRSCAGDNIKPLQFEISLGEFGKTRFAPGSKWQEFVTKVTIPYYNEQPVRTNVILQMPSAGVAWFDMLQVVEAIDINQCINPELRGELSENDLIR